MYFNRQETSKDSFMITEKIENVFWEKTNLFFYSRWNFVPSKKKLSEKEKIEKIEIREENLKIFVKFVGNWVNEATLLEELSQELESDYQKSNNNILGKNGILFVNLTKLVVPILPLSELKNLGCFFIGTWM